MYDEDLQITQAESLTPNNCNLILALAATTTENIREIYASAKMQKC